MDGDELIKHLDRAIENLRNGGGRFEYYPRNPRPVPDTGSAKTPPKAKKQARELEDV